MHQCNTAAKIKWNITCDFKDMKALIEFIAGTDDGYNF